MTNQPMHDLQQSQAVRRQRQQPNKISTPAVSQPTAARLQRVLGNQALGQLVGQTRIQAKLTLGPVGDQYEQEADHVAKQVVQQMSSVPTAANQANAAVQRQAPPEEEEKLAMKPLADTIHRAAALPEEEQLQQKPLVNRVQRAGLPEEEEMAQAKPAVQRTASAEGGEVDGNIEASIQRARGNGSALAAGVRAPMESAFGADFGGVNIHTSREADSLNHSLQARAFTTGKDIFFRQGEYQPENSGGRELLAHELTHVVQQTGRA